jgi:hypothetical protein
VLRSESAAAHGESDSASSGSLGRVALVVGLLAAGGLGLCAAQQRERRLQEQAARSERLRLEAAAPPASQSGPADATPQSFVPSPYTPPVGALAFPSPRVEATPAAVKALPTPADDASPTPSSMEEEWARARELLDPPLQKIEAETAEMQQRSAQFLYTCLGSPPGNWLAAVKNGEFVKTGAPYSKYVGTMDCELARRQLVARGNVIKAELVAAEGLARTSRVLPGHLRKLVEAHQLEVWDAY